MLSFDANLKSKKHIDNTAQIRRISNLNQVVSS